MARAEEGSRQRRNLRKSTSAESNQSTNSTTGTPLVHTPDTHRNRSVVDVSESFVRTPPINNYHHPIIPQDDESKIDDNGQPSASRSFPLEALPQRTVVSAPLSPMQQQQSPPPQQQQQHEWQSSTTQRHRKQPQHQLLFKSDLLPQLFRSVRSCSSLLPPITTFP